MVSAGGGKYRINGIPVLATDDNWRLMRLSGNYFSVSPFVLMN